jgi:hypothetical protein
MSVNKIRYVIQQDVEACMGTSVEYWEVIDLEVIDVRNDEPTIVKFALTEPLAQRYADRLNAGEIICECGKTGQSDHTCPFKEEKDDDFVSLCNCCKDCQQECLIEGDK